MMTRDQVMAVGRALVTLAGSCDGAVSRDEQGFNRHDAEHGHSLAAWFSDKGFLTDKQGEFGAKIVKKYKRQLDAELYAIIFPPKPEQGQIFTVTRKTRVA